RIIDGRIFEDPDWRLRWRQTQQSLCPFQNHEFRAFYVGFDEVWYTAHLAAVAVQASNRDSNYEPRWPDAGLDFRPRYRRYSRLAADGELGFPVMIGNGARVQPCVRDPIFSHVLTKDLKSVRLRLK